MREALRVLRDLYSARHYCRSCTNFVPFSHLFLPLLCLSLSPFFLVFFTLFSSFLLFSFFFFLFFITFPFHSSPPLKTIMLPAQCPSMRIADSVYSKHHDRTVHNETIHFSITTLFGISLRSFLPPSSLFRYAQYIAQISSINRITPIFRSRNRRVIDHYRIFNNSPHLSSTSFSTPPGEEGISL